MPAASSGTISPARTEEPGAAPEVAGAAERLLAMSPLAAVVRLAAPTTSSALRSLLSWNTGSSGRPKRPPMALISSHAISWPRRASVPEGESEPVSGTMPPTGIGSPAAFAPRLTSAIIEAPATIVPVPASAAPFRKLRRPTRKLSSERRQIPRFQNPNGSPRRADIETP